MTPQQKKEWAAMAQMIVRLGEEFNKVASDIIFMNDRIDLLKRRVDVLTAPKRKWWKLWKRK